MRPDVLKKCIGWSLVEPSQQQAIVRNTSVAEDSGETEGISIKMEEESIAEESVKTNATADGIAEPGVSDQRLLTHLYVGGERKL